MGLTVTVSALAVALRLTQISPPPAWRGGVGKSEEWRPGIQEKGKSFICFILPFPSVIDFNTELKEYSTLSLSLFFSLNRTLFSHSSGGWKFKMSAGLLSSGASLLAGLLADGRLLTAFPRVCLLWLSLPAVSPGSLLKETGVQSWLV